MCGEDQAAKDLVAGLIEDMGYVPDDLGATDTCAVMEAPRRHAAVYGEEYRVAMPKRSSTPFATGPRPLPRPATTERSRGDPE